MHHLHTILGFLLALAIAIGVKPSIQTTTPKDRARNARDQHPLNQRPITPTNHNETTANLKDKIKNVVFIIMENRSVDNLLGGQRLPGLDNPINNGPFCNPYNLSVSANSGRGDGGEDGGRKKKKDVKMACSKAKDYDSILDDPDHEISGNNVEFYGTFCPDEEGVAAGLVEPSLDGFVHEQIRLHGRGRGMGDESKLAEEVINYYTEEQVPVVTTLSKEFVVFNRFFSDVPGPTNPNRAAFHSGTSHGHGTNDAGFDTSSLPQHSIFQQLTETNHTWTNYYTQPDIIDALFFQWTAQTGAATDPTKIKPVDRFYADAASGSLPEFAFINPSCCGVGTNSMHPTGLISAGERLLKDVYDAVRNSPQWNETLLIISFDETGGFHDHVPPPLAARPDNLTYTSVVPDSSDGSDAGGRRKECVFHFNRVGGRLPTWLVSPWVAKGFVEQDGVNERGEQLPYFGTSVLKTLGELWDFAPFTPRVEQAPGFAHLVGSEMRVDAPLSMPAPAPFLARGGGIWL